MFQLKYHYWKIWISVVTYLVLICAIYVSIMLSLFYGNFDENRGDPRILVSGEFQQSEGLNLFIINYSITKKRNNFLNFLEFLGSIKIVLF